MGGKEEAEQPAVLVIFIQMNLDNLSSASDHLIHI